MDALQCASGTTQMLGQRTSHDSKLHSQILQHKFPAISVNDIVCGAEKIIFNIILQPVQQELQVLGSFET